MMRRLIFVVTALVMWSAASLASAITVVVGDAEQVNLSSAVERLEDVEGRLTLPDILSAKHSPRFAPGSPGIGFSASAWWLRVAFRNDGAVPLERRLDLGNRTLQEVDLYTPQPDGTWQRQTTGSRLPFAERPIAIGNFAFTLTLPARATTEVYLRVRSTGYLGITVSPSLWQPNAHARAWQEECAVWMLVTGILCGLAVVNLAIYAYLRERSYLLYVASVLSYWVAMNSANGGLGAAYSFFWPASPLLEQSMWVIAVLVTALFPVWFIADLLGIPRQQPRLWRLVLACQGLLFLAIAAQVIGTLLPSTEPGKWLQRFYLIGMSFWAPIYPAIIWGAAQSWRSGARVARFLAIGYAPLMLGIVANVWMNNLNGEPIYLQPLIAAGIFELLVMALALADRFLQERQAKVIAQAETIATLRRNEQELEAKVTERTEALVARTDALAASEARSKELLHNILPETVAEELANSGQAQPIELKSATLLFTDFSGFTQAASTMPAQQMVAELNAIFAAFDDICDAQGVEKIKTIGDAYMAAAGVPVPCADHAQRAVRAGLAMCAFLAERNQRASFKWQLRVGIHSGPVVAGVVGKRKYAFDVWGDTVNIASRMESAGEAGKVNISAYTHHLIQGDFICTYRGRVAAKGKGEVDMYFVEAVAR